MLSLKMLLTPKCELNLKRAVNCFCFQRQVSQTLIKRSKRAFPPHPVTLETFKTANTPAGKMMALFTL